MKGPKCARASACGRCLACRVRRERERLAMHVLAMNMKREPEPSCTCAGDDDAPFGGHKVRCPRYGKRPL